MSSVAKKMLRSIVKLKKRFFKYDGIGLNSALHDLLICN